MTAPKAAEVEAGYPRNRLPDYMRGWLAYRALMLWPIAVYDRAPSWLHRWAWLYAEDARQVAATLAAHPSKGE
jgi:hypothetical protein